MYDARQARLTADGPDVTLQVPVREVALSETPHYRIMRDFMNNPAIMMERLFEETPKDDGDL